MSELRESLNSVFAIATGFPCSKIVEDLTRVVEVLKGKGKDRTSAEDAALREAETALEFSKLMVKSCDAAAGHIKNAWDDLSQA